MGPEMYTSNWAKTTLYFHSFPELEPACDPSHTAG